MFRSVRGWRFFPAVFFAILVAILGAHTVGGFWRGDDTAILAHLLKHPLFDIFFVPAAWQELSSANLTPWLSFSFYVNYALAGLNPLVFYLHHLAALWLVAIFARRVLAHFSSERMASVGVVLFLLGTPVLRVSDTLFTRHYLEGLLLSLVAVDCFLRYQHTGKARYQVAATLGYALAMTAKEVYVPLAIVLVFLTTGNVRDRLRQTWPHLAMLCLYALWRSYMLSGYVGGYASFSSYVEPAFWRDVIATVVRVPTLLFGNFALLITLPAACVILAGLWLQPRRLPRTLLVGALVCAPLVPLVAYPGITTADRYLWLPWFMLCLALSVQAHSIVEWSRGHSNLSARANRACLRSMQIALGVVCVLLLVHRERVQRAERPGFAAIDTQMRFIRDNDASRAFVPEPSIAANFWMVRTFGEIKQVVNPADSMPKPIVDAIFLDAALPLYAYSAACNCMQDISATIPERLAQFAQARNAAPLTVTISNDDGWFVWSFGPYTEGSYNVVSDFVGNLPVPAVQRGLRTSIRRNVDFYLRYTAPEGWVTYSPPQRLTPDGTVLTWSRE
jgi:hypothetical protein